jgi:acyl dehydratase
MLPMPNAFDAPITNRFFEDYVAGHVHEFGFIAVTEDEIIRFSRQYDPQAFHTDPAAALRTQFGGLIASGWHTAGLMMRLIVDHYLSHVASLASPGVDELRWTQPVRPGDTLSVRATILETRLSRTKPDRGVVRTQFEVLNQHGAVVMSVKAMNMLRARAAVAE